MRSVPIQLSVLIRSKDKRLAKASEHDECDAAKLAARALARALYVGISISLQSQYIKLSPRDRYARYRD